MIQNEKPFYRKHLEVNDKSLVMTFRINEEEQALIRQARQLLDIEADGKAVKICFKVGLNVLQSVFGEKLLKYLSSTKRERLSDYEKPPKVSKEDFVIRKGSDL